MFLYIWCPANVLFRWLTKASTPYLMAAYTDNLAFPYHYCFVQEHVSGLCFLNTSLRHISTAVSKSQTGNSRLYLHFFGMMRRHFPESLHFCSATMLGRVLKKRPS